MAKIQLRNYQLEAVQAVRQEFEGGINKQLIVLPTGAGKTIIMAAIAQSFNQKTLILAHRDELIEQAQVQIRLCWPEADIGICKSGRMETNHLIVLGSVQSCFRSKYLNQLKKENFTILMIDESHHAPSNSYQKIINELSFADSTDKLLLGVTATPQRADKKQLGDTFEKVVFSRSIGTMIKSGHLSPVVGRKILTAFSLDGVTSRYGDFAVGQLDTAVNTAARNQFIVSKYLEYAKDRKAIAFCASVQHCKDLADAFKRKGVKAAAIWGTINPKQRKKILRDLKKGTIQVVTSCSLLTEGFDEPSINAIVMCRPTRSTSLYTQMCGRGLRPFKGKENCLVLDFSDKANNLDSIMTLSKSIPEAQQLVDHITRNEAPKIAQISVVKEVDKEFDILGQSRFIWIEIGDEERSLMDDDGNEIVIFPNKEGNYNAVLYSLNGSVTPINKQPLHKDACSSIAEDYARSHLKIQFAETNAGYLQERWPTEKQVQYVKRVHAYKLSMTRSEAALVIRKHKSLNNKRNRKTPEPITSHQKFFLEKIGIETEGLTKLKAMSLISIIKGRSHTETEIRNGTAN